MARARDKILSQRALRERLAWLRARGKRSVLTSGCYDLLHVGHLRSFEVARGLGERLVVGVNRDTRVRELKGPGRPIVPERQRAEMIAGLEVVDYVVLFSEDDAGPLIRRLRPDVYCKGGEYRGTRIPEQDAIESVGGSFRLLAQVPRVRSSALIARIRRR
jgi:D-beta-D-heptose 7-phosphate kinase/D-beta-D-heptose 1-phosphate adenosyltransferase